MLVNFDSYTLTHRMVSVGHMFTTVVINLGSYVAHRRITDHKVMEVEHR